MKEKEGDGVGELRPPPLTSVTSAPAGERIARGLSVGSADPHLLCHDDSKAELELLPFEIEEHRRHVGVADV